MHALRSRLVRGLATLALATVAGAALSAGTATAQGQPTAIVIYDTSGSMEGFLGTERKRRRYEVAREVLRTHLSKLSANSRLGLIAYGHRQRGCTDVELIAPPAAGSPERVLGPIDRIKPTAGRGTGPLALALREAQKALQAEGAANSGPASIIVVHDGPDNCSQDPCQAAADLAASGRKIPVHLISIELKKSDVPRVACVAKLTGGRMLEVHDAAGIDAAVGEVVNLALLQDAAPEPAAEVKEPEPPAPPSEGDSEGPPRARLTASLADNAPAIATPLVWRLVKEGAGAEEAIERTAAEFAEPLAAGKYDITIRHGLVVTKGTIEIADKGLTSIRVPLNAGSIRITARAARSGEPLDDALVTILRIPAEEAEAPASEPVWLGRSETEIIVPSGKYKVRLDDGLVHAEQTVNLAAGGRAVAEFTPGLGHLHLSAALVEGGPASVDASFVISIDDPDAPLGRREISRSAHPEPKFTLPAGTYYVSARLGDAEVRQRIAVGPGETVQRAIALGMARIYVSAALETGAIEGQVLHRVLTLDSEMREIARSSEQTATFTLAAGRYRIETQLGNENVRATSDIEVHAGKDGRLTQKLAAGSVTMAPASGGGSAAGQNFWEVRDARGSVVWRALGSQTVTTLLAPGRYTTRSEIGDKVLESAFDLAAGEQRTVNPGAP